MKFILSLVAVFALSACVTSGRYFPQYKSTGSKPTRRRSKRGSGTQ